MERLAFCSKILYDRDIIKTKKELYDLKDPKKIFKNFNESEQYKNNFYEKIKAIIYEFIQSANESHMRYWGISDSTVGSICDQINILLFEFTKNKEWSERIAFENVYTLVSGLFHSLTTSSLWEMIYELSDRENISEFVYSNVFWYFEHLFPKMFYFKCNTCNIITDYLDEITNVCYTCSKK